MTCYFLKALFFIYTQEKTGIMSRGETSSDESNSEVQNHTQWSDDYQLLPWGSRGLFNEYLEMSMSI